MRWNAIKGHFPAIAWTNIKHLPLRHKNINGHKPFGNRASGNIKSVTNRITKSIVITFIEIRSNTDLFPVSVTGLTQAFTVSSAEAFIRRIGRAIQMVMAMRITENSVGGAHLFAPHTHQFNGICSGIKGMPLRWEACFD